MSVSRRRFLAGAGLLGAGTGVFSVSEAAAVVAGRGQPRRIIHLVSDGMSMGTLTCGDVLSKVVRERPTAWMELYRRADAVSALMDMRSLNSVVTDSAAASSSWGSGSRIVNGALNMFADGRQLRPLCTLFGELGWARGLVTTTEITHATPAGFAANVKDRDMATTIAVQYLERRLDVLLGGGRQYFDGGKRSDKRDLRGEYASWGYTVMDRREELMRASTKERWLGTFASGHLPYTVDRTHSTDLRRTVPTLAEMAGRALEWLMPRDQFLLQVEGGRVDHGAHSSDAAATLFDQLAFDDALTVCLDFQRRHPDTLLVVTTDHGNSNPGLNGMGSEYGGSLKCLTHLTRVRRSFGEIQAALIKAAGKGAVEDVKSADGKTTRQVLRIEPRLLASVLEESTGYQVPQAKAEAFSRYLQGENRPLYDQLDSQSAQLGQLMANYLGIGWTGTSHTADYVPLLAVGPGAERFRGFIKNTDVFRNYTDLVGIKFRNPELPLLAGGGRSAADAEWGALA